MFTRFLVGTIAFGALVGVLAPHGPRASDPHGADPGSSAPAPAAATPASNAGPVVVERQGDGHFYVDARVNGQPVHFLVDTGASMVALTQHDAQAIGLPFTRAEFGPVGRGASGLVNGKAVRLGSVGVGERTAYDVPGAIIDDGLGVSLLGQSFLERLGGVTIEGDRMTLR